MAKQEKKGIDVKLDSVKFTGEKVRVVFVTSEVVEATDFLRYLGCVVKIEVEESQRNLFQKE